MHREMSHALKGEIVAVEIASLVPIRKPLFFDGFNGPSVEQPLEIGQLAGDNGLSTRQTAFDTGFGSIEGTPRLSELW